MPIGAPGWPELACWTASIAKARMALAMAVMFLVVWGMLQRVGCGKPWILAAACTGAQALAKVPLHQDRLIQVAGEEKVHLVCKT